MEGEDEGGVEWRECAEEFDDGEKPPGKCKRKSVKGAGKLWTKAQFPEGMKGPAVWNMDNLYAAQRWTCPCAD
eukprot:608589-Pleurochrysis_carterae.AAC.1